MSRNFLVALKEEYEAGEPVCDHSVGICACGERVAVETITMLLDGKQLCNNCDGWGFYQDETNCEVCVGKGVVSI